MISKNRGFTIVELLIVIVVIAILASISIVAYNGIQTRAENTKTISAVAQWVKILKMYEVDNGSFPTTVSCLGEGYTYGYTGQDASGRHCRQDNAGGAGISSNPTFMTMVSKYIEGSGPTPSLATTVGSESTPWYRGAYFYIAYAGSGARIDYVLKGADASCTALSIGGVLQQSTASTYSNGVMCSARIGEPL